MKYALYVEGIGNIENGNQHANLMGSYQLARCKHKTKAVSLFENGKPIAEYRPNGLSYSDLVSPQYLLLLLFLSIPLD